VTSLVHPRGPEEQVRKPGLIGPNGEGLTLVTEQVVEFGGVERILDTVLQRYPRASVVAVGFDPRPGFQANGPHERLMPSSMAGGGVRLAGPGGGHRHHYLGPVYARRIASVPLPAGSTVISFGGMAWTLAASTPPDGRHLGYIGGLPRPFYGHRERYACDYRLPLRLLIRAALPALRAHHRSMLKRPQRLLVNSRASAASLRKVTDRPVGVLYPPARTEFFTPAARERTHFVAVARLVTHKRIDLLVDAFRGLRERLVIAGEGPGLERMRAGAPSNVSFVGQLEDEDLREVYRSSRALVSASDEEFGICLAEAQAAGIPVIAPRAGGAREIVRDGESGILFDQLDPGSVARAVRRLESLGIEPSACRSVGERFSEERFLEGLEQAIEALPTRTAGSTPQASELRPG
jgi:glycosyltransferase involved in cell wall biosynthesis